MFLIHDFKNILKGEFPMNEQIDENILDGIQVRTSEEDEVLGDVLGNQIQEENIVAETIIDTELEEAIRREQEITEEYSKLDMNTLLVLVFVAVIISMIFEPALKFVKRKTNEKKEKQEDYTNYRKAMFGLLIAYIVFLVVFYIIGTAKVGFPIEVIIAIEVASIFSVLFSTFFKFKNPFRKK